MAESTYQNEVYVDVNGKVCKKNDKNVLRKISRQEAVRAGLIPASEAPPPITDEGIVFHADGGSHRVASGVGLNAAPQNLGNPEEVRVTNPAEESLRVQGKAEEADAKQSEREAEENDEADEKSVKKSDVEDKAVHKSAKR
jgi:hypothetical protein